MCSCACVDFPVVLVMTWMRAVNRQHWFPPERLVDTACALRVRYAHVKSNQHARRRSIIHKRKQKHLRMIWKQRANNKTSRRMHQQKNPMNPNVGVRRNRRYGSGVILFSAFVLILLWFYIDLWFSANPMVYPGISENHGVRAFELVRRTACERSMHF